MFAFDNGDLVYDGEKEKYRFFINVNKDKVSYEVVKIKSPEYELVDRLLNDAWIYVYAFAAIHYLDIMMAILAGYLADYFIFNKNCRSAFGYPPVIYDVI